MTTDPSSPTGPSKPSPSPSGSGVPPWVLIALGVAALVLGLVGVAWIAWPADDAPPPRLEAQRERGERAGKAERAKATRMRAKGAKRAQRPRGEARARASKADPKLPPDEKAAAREEFREERLADIDSRLDAFAAEAGWDPERTEEVRAILVETADGISNSLGRVDRGEATWEEERATLRQFRLEQAEKVEALIGSDFDRFVVAMGFERFLGEEPIRGRLE